MSQEFINSILDTNQKQTDEIIKLKALNTSLINQNTRYKNEIKDFKILDDKLCERIFSLQSHVAELQNTIKEEKIELMSAFENFEFINKSLNKETSLNNDLKKEIKELISENKILLFNQELHQGIISDLKLEIREEKIENNKLTREYKNVTELFTIFEEPETNNEPFIMEFVSIPTTSYLDEYKLTSNC